MAPTTDDPGAEQRWINEDLAAEAGYDPDANELEDKDGSINEMIGDVLRSVPAGTAHLFLLGCPYNCECSSSEISCQ